MKRGKKRDRLEKEYIKLAVAYMMEEDEGDKTPKAIARIDRMEEIAILVGDEVANSCWYNKAQGVAKKAGYKGKR